MLYILAQSFCHLRQFQNINSIDFISEYDGHTNVDV